MPNVFKLGKGPEHGHVNCSIFIPENSPWRLWITLSSQTRIKIM